MTRRGRKPRMEESLVSSHDTLWHFFPRYITNNIKLLRKNSLGKWKREINQIKKKKHFAYSFVLSNELKTKIKSFFLVIILKQLPIQQNNN